MNTQEMAEKLRLLREPIIPVQPYIVYDIQAYRTHWDKLHKYAVINRYAWDAKKAENWILEWEANIPDFGCTCRDGWGKIKATVLQNSATGEEFFRWTVEVHNKVNEKLGKPIITYEEACLIHGF